MSCKMLCLEAYKHRCLLEGVSDLSYLSQILTSFRVDDRKTQLPLISKEQSWRGDGRANVRRDYQGHGLAEKS